MILKELKEMLIKEGASDVGISNIHEYLPAELKMFKTCITVAVRLSDAIVNEIVDSPTFTYYHHYKAVNNLIDLLTLKGVLFLESKGYFAMSVAASQSVHGKDNGFSGVLSHKIGAVLSGMGFIGKNNLFVHNRFGPRVRLGTILTTYEPEEKIENHIMEPQCGQCNLCIISCPAQALRGSTWYFGIDRNEMIDPHACSTYMKEKFKYIGRGQVCGICMRVCPYGNEVKR
ncbi:4Fe-4S ferredoxin, iron-sulfur binding domain protein [Caldicellulosiruptor saccharolyticus DSM 8903]|uniref:4Fe-4S ferredoxin, iron-sulfur binding domain protein n=1 Tax=Caldicellulosiruptor saccharolyticus (strain ATCC 43494 / DSM 8903 / Tp8T 6331) TaxID=351627 RepID=A4XJ65_CALS8|nr:4Fe-4S double cluster binding domain-containing protein [Caldicellulosiruptor saccharolyticus]ABP66950.1 4Fe-4S ferredoxin, iron-sulfur binding domain protein [Caldicellulosiruptor saccharolyticus DSM 8903]